MYRLVIALAIFAVSSALAAPVLSIDPGVTRVSKFQTFELAVDISSVTDLYSYQLDIAFDPDVLQASAVTEGPFLRSGGPTLFTPFMIDNAGGTITFIGGLLLGMVPGVSGSGSLAVLNFTSTTYGTSPIVISEILLNDSGGNPIVPADPVNGIVNVIPEPATVWLMGAGVSALLLRYRRLSALKRR